MRKLTTTELEAAARLSTTPEWKVVKAVLTEEFGLVQKRLLNDVTNEFRVNQGRGQALEEVITMVDTAMEYIRKSRG